VLVGQVDQHGEAAVFGVALEDAPDEVDEFGFGQRRGHGGSPGRSS